MTRWSLALLLASCVTLLGAHAQAASPQSPPVNVRLQSPWEPTPLLLEALEAAFDEENEAFWPLVSRMSDPEFNPLPPTTDSPFVCYIAAKAYINDLGLLEDAGSRDNWEMALALHSQAPKVAAFWQVARTTGAEERWLRHREERAYTDSECTSWVDWYGKVVCGADELQTLLDSDDVEATKVATYPFDHVHQTSTNATTTAVLYGHPLSPNFHSLHKAVFERASYTPGFRYVLRWRPGFDATTRNQTSSFMAGYGAALDLKKVDYLVIDDRKLAHAAGAPSLAEEEGSGEGTISQLHDRQWLDEMLLAGQKKPANISQPLEEAEMGGLGLKAAQAVVSAEDPLRVFAQLTQDFPLHSAALARGGVKPSMDLDHELHQLQMTKIRPGLGDIWLNGQPLATNEQTPLGLLKVLRKERSLINSLTTAAPELGLNYTQAIGLLSTPAVGKAQTPEAEQVVFFDASDRIEREQASVKGSGGDEDDDDDDDGFASPIVWWNDIEEDEAFADFKRLPLRSLLRPMHPQSFPRVGRNLFNVVLTVDLANRNTCTFLTEHVAPLLERITVHWGLVPGGLERGDDSDSTKIARLYWHLWEEHGHDAGVEFLHLLATSGPLIRPIEARAAQKAFIKLLDKLEPSEDHSSQAKEVISKPSAREPAVHSYVRRLKLELADEPRGHILFNGQHFPLVDPRTFFQLIHQVAAIQLQQIARPIYFNEITDDDDVSTYFYDLPLSFASRSNLVFPSVNTTTGEVKGPKTRAVDLAKALQLAPEQARRFLYPNGAGQVNATMWLVADFDTDSGLHLLRQALLTMVNDKAPTFRLGLVHTREHTGASSGETPSLSAFLAHLVQNGQLDQLPPADLLDVISEATPAHEEATDEFRIQGKQQIVFQPSGVNEAKLKGWTAVADVVGDKFWQTYDPFLRAAGIPTDRPAILVNGRLLTHLDPLDVSSTDLASLVKNELARRIDPVVAALDDIAPAKLSTLNRSQAADAIAVISSAISATYYRDETQEGIFAPPNVQRTNMFDRLGVEFSRFEVGDPAKARLRFQAIVDPLSETAQKWASLFKLVADMPDVHLQVILNPVRNMSEMPLKRFFRYSAPRRLAFDERTGQEVATTLSFLDMPSDAVLTMGLDAPPAWLTMAKEAVYDLDNIRLRDVPEDGKRAGVLAVYELKHLLIEGHAREAGAGERGGNAIPRGLQLELQTPDGSETLDTIVMANLAYFQFRARPGLYRLKIRSGGKSEELYEMRSVGNLGWDSPEVEETGNDITLDSLDGLTIYPRVAKRKGKEDEELLEDLDAEDGGEVEYDDETAGKSSFSSILSKAAQNVKSALAPAPSRSTHDRVHIFTVASGHLYERMTYIMILSVLRHAKTLPVKFWFIENFLSPSFKSFIPHLAQAYGFKYELVTYAWPHWLRAQTEKQRTIWGYKILFLDVLFPLDVEKVIFVDSDQVVRTDMAELLDVDLKGAPYGFPPMGDDSEDMDGYRFWKRGFWKDFLRGRPYHISALYVVDLQRFRTVAAGDKLRGQYQALSSDPNSLSNLDQDLPQTLMFHVPLHTLDQRWLWCETWCSHDWLHEAKTIDLCSNPKTHEAKLDRARRQIPEWTELDEEVQTLARKVGAAEGMRESAEGEKQGQVSGEGHPPSHDEL